MAETASKSGLRLEVRRHFAAPRQRVWDAWTQAEALTRWFAPGAAHVVSADVDLRVGGEYRVHMQGPDGTSFHVRGTYREITPPSRLAFTWQWQHEPPDYVMVVTVQLEESAEGGTELFLTHEGFRSEADASGHNVGWEGLFAKLETIVA